MRKRSKLFIALFILLHVAGFLTSVRAIMDVRTSQGAIAWVISLNTFPSVSLPAYWIFGNSKFSGYVTARKAEVVEAQPLLQQLLSDFVRYGLKDEIDQTNARLVQRLAKMPFTKGNTARLLIDGEETFDAIFKGIDSAKSYVLVQYYILREDELGIKLQNALIKKAKEGVTCLVIYDEIGSRLSKEYSKAFEDAGIKIFAFNTRQGKGNRFQVNFRNHRKIVIADGEVAYVGGLNVGNEYLGLNPKLTPWRDTHVEVRGPVVQAVQLSFAEDWYWASKEGLPKLNWTPKQVPGGTVTALSLPSGPADEFETASLFFLDMINGAK
ncbi:MAG: cardiolipin synthase, partial [Synergistaceae bacterium]|nr:cardiolipin synthase [Synergistaceae bacterium]